MQGKLKKNKVLLIFFSLVLAIGLWAYILGEESVSVSKKVDLVVYPPEDMAVVNKAHQIVTVLLSVPRNMLRLLEEQPVTLAHKITEVSGAGNYSFYLEAQDVQKPSAIDRKSTRLNSSHYS